MVRHNQQLELDLELDIPAADRTPDSRMPTWVLLVHLDGDAASCELSLPRHIGAEGYIESWVERIPLPTVRFNEVVLDVDDAPDTEDPDNSAVDVDFDVPEL